MIMRLDPATADKVLASAANTARLAPSIYNSQPWRWRVAGGVADLYAVPQRRLRVTDPDGRMLMISCGAAIHHAQVALAAEGVVCDVALRPGDDPDHLARLRPAATIEVTPTAMKALQDLEIRHTDRRPLLEQPMPEDTLAAMRSAAARFGIGVEPLDRGQVIELASATSRAQRDQLADEAARAEFDAWIGHGRPLSAGIPDTAIPDSAPQTTVPVRDFGHVGTLPVGDGHDNAATYAILYGNDDEPASWLRAGQALSALWLTATDRGIAVLPLSAAAEEPSTRTRLRAILSGVGRPYLALRLGVPDPALPPPERTPRLAPETIIEIG